MCLIHSYANDRHERRVRELFREEYPECAVSLSCEVLPEYREYERAMTTLVDAFVKPHMGRYLQRIHEELGPDLRAKPFLVMQSSGGVISSEQVVNKPITTALSGPAAGALGAAVVAKIAGFEDLVTLDAGGTSTDLCLIEAGVPKVTNGGSVGPFPVRIPMIDIKTVGTGGGSIAWISREGHLKVGPKSAGAVPGPMCYPNGGEQPTITDANLVLGRIPPALIGGGIKLDAERSRTGIADLGKRLGSGMGVEQLAEGIIEIANWNQANCIRQMTIQRGIDPRGLALLSFGGSGPAQSPAVMELLGHEGVHRAAQPGQPLGVRAARGRLAHRSHRDPRHARGRARPGGARRRSTVSSRARRAETLARDGIDPRNVRLVREADVRYVGQSMEVRVQAPGGAIDPAFVAGLVDAFHAAHEKAFGYGYRGKQKVELVNVCVSGFGLIDRPALPKLAAGAPAKPRTARRAFFGGAFVETPVYDRAASRRGRGSTGRRWSRSSARRPSCSPGRR